MAEMVRVRQVEQAASGVDHAARAVVPSVTALVNAEDLKGKLIATEGIPAEKATAITSAFYNANVEAGNITVKKIVTPATADGSGAAGPEKISYEITVGDTVLTLPEAVLGNTDAALNAIVTLQLGNPVDETADDAAAIDTKDAALQQGLAAIKDVVAGSVEGLQTAR